ncbi:MAG: hypothetical protein ABI947_12885 [Chloroflexota bacterium]
MQRTNDIAPSEWRWVIIFSGLLVAITLLPYAWAFASDSPNDNWHFMGMLPNQLDGATYLSKIGEGARGDWLFTLQYTSEPHTGAAINEFYLLLGHLSRILGLSPLVMYHVARLVTGFVMFVSIYHLGSVIWPRLRPRRLFFSLLAVGSGLGWLLLTLSAGFSGGSDFNRLPTDFSMPESIPFYATFVNPHFPLTIALISLLAATFIMVFRPGFDQQPTLSNGGFSVVLISAALAVIQPQGLVPIMVTLVVYLAILTVRTRRIPMLELNWIVLVILPTLPFLIYYLAVVRDNEAMRIWNAQNFTPSPPIWNYIVGFGLPLLVAIPGVWRAIRRFERDGDRFMLIWLIVNVLLLYAPFNLQRRLAIGLIIPIAYFAVRALEDFWFHRILPPWRDAALVALFVFMIPSNILTLGIPIFGVVNPAEGIKVGQILTSGHDEAIHWLNANAQSGDIILAPPLTSLWIPAYSDLRVVYGHPYETLNAKDKLPEVQAWYLGESDQECRTLLEKYAVRYVVSEDIEAPGAPTTGCYKALDNPVASFDHVFVYAIR